MNRFIRNKLADRKTRKQSKRLTCKQPEKLALRFVNTDLATTLSLGNMKVQASVVVRAT